MSDHYEMKISDLEDQIKDLESKLATAAEALSDIKNHNTLGGRKYNNYSEGYYGIVDFASKALEKIK